MEAGKPCSTRTFHTLHTFHTDSAHLCASVQVRAPAYVYTRVHHPFLGMESMEGMEEGRSTRLSNVHTSATPIEGMEGREQK